MAAVQRAREAGRRARCVSNLRQIGAALQQYYATHGSYPLGVTASFFLPPVDSESRAPAITGGRIGSSYSGGYGR
jgi:hypothetical protein